MVCGVSSAGAAIAACMAIIGRPMINTVVKNILLNLVFMVLLSLSAH
jgi:hypothetical protein